MRKNYPQVRDWLGLSEGGYVNDPDDPGGPTNMGITQRVYDGWRIANGLKPQSVKKITKAEADQIYKEQYFAPVWFDRLPSGLDYAVLDFAVNSGVYRAVSFLQRLLKVDDDGIMGNVTFAAIKSLEGQNGITKLVQDLCIERFRFVQTLPKWWKFGKGWTRRIMGETIGAQIEDTGVIDRAMRMSMDKKVVGAPKPAPGKATGTPKPQAPNMPTPKKVPWWVAFLQLLGLRRE